MSQGSARFETKAHKAVRSDAMHIDMPWRTTMDGRAGGRGCVCVL